MVKPSMDNPWASNLFSWDLGMAVFLSFQVATSSGDSTIKIWDVAKEKCKHTLTDHTQLAAQILNPLAFKASISLILFSIIAKSIQGQCGLVLSMILEIL